MQQRACGNHSKSGPGSLLVLTPQVRGVCEKHTRCWPQFSSSSQRICMRACVTSFNGSMDGLLTRATGKFQGKQAY